MSLATLKKKTAAKYNNSSVNTKHGFSLNGGYRNQGYVGQTSLSRYLPRTPMRGNTPRGHGGCCGTYRVSSIIQSGVTSTEDPSIIKKSVITTKGMLDVRFCDEPCNVVKPDSNLNANTQGEQVIRKQKKTLACIQTSQPNCYNIGNCKRPICICTKPESDYLPISSSAYIQNLGKKCIENDIVYVPVSICRQPIL